MRDEQSSDRIHFNFYDVPDLIVRKNYKRKDYEHILKLLNKVKANFLNAKRSGFCRGKMGEFFKKHSTHQEEDPWGTDFKDSDKSDGERKDSVKDVHITEEDLIPCSYLTDVLSELHHKHEAQRHILLDFIAQCKEEQQKKCRQLGIESGKQKQEIEKAAFAEFLNKDLEMRHSKIFTQQYKQKNLYFELHQNKDKP